MYANVTMNQFSSEELGSAALTCVPLPTEMVLRLVAVPQALPYGESWHSQPSL